MKYMGAWFEIPNGYGNYLSDILEPLSVKCYQWVVDDDEIHVLKDNEFTNEFLFSDEDRIISGEKLYESTKNNTYYMIFITLRAFLKDGNIESVSNYKEFLESDCQIILAVYDCSEVMFWCKDSQLVSKMYNHALSKGYKNINYISEEDLIARKYYLDSLE